MRATRRLVRFLVDKRCVSERSDWNWLEGSGSPKYRFDWRLRLSCIDRLLCCVYFEVVASWLVQLINLLSLARLLDEVTTHVDAPTIQAIAVALQKFTGGIILVTHDR